jgi:hypothetical protein
VSDAKKLLADCGFGADILVLDPSLPGAVDFARSLRRDRDGLKIIAVTDGGVEPDLRLQPEATFTKPPEVDEKALADWIHMIQSILSAVYA